MPAILDSFVFRIVPHSRSRDASLQIRAMAPRSLYSLGFDAADAFRMRRAMLAAAMETPPVTFLRCATPTR